MFKNAVNQIVNQIKKSKSLLAIMGETHCIIQHPYMISLLVKELNKQGFNKFFYESRHHKQNALVHMSNLPVHPDTYTQYFTNVDTHVEFENLQNQLFDAPQDASPELLQALREYESRSDYNFLRNFYLPVGVHQLFKTATSQKYDIHLVDCDVSMHYSDQAQLDLCRELGLDNNLFGTAQNNQNAKGMHFRNQFMANRIHQTMKPGDKGILIVGGHHTHNIFIDGTIVKPIQNELQTRYAIPAFTCCLGDYYSNMVDDLREAHQLMSLSMNLRRIELLYHMNTVSVVKPEIPNTKSLPDCWIIFPEKHVYNMYENNFDKKPEATLADQIMQQINTWNILCTLDNNIAQRIHPQ